jgi:H+/Cl- antiporter ClcA/predicted transcriptional regulator
MAGRNAGPSGRLLGALGRLGYPEDGSVLGDFTTSWRLLPVSALAIVIGAIGAGVAWTLIRLIGLFTNLFFFLRWDTHLVSPGPAVWGPGAIFVPVVGGLIIGLMARYGSERIRGHGIPEAIEAILIKGSQIQPRVAVLKPLSAAISIGSGGPFGAEGPIIMSGGAFGSLVAQYFHLTSAERRTLLVAGAAGGMTGVFGTPVAAVLLAGELLLFEWKARSLVPVGLAAVSAEGVRTLIIGTPPLFPTPPHQACISPACLGGATMTGLLGGCLAGALTAAVYGAEDAFRKLPLHWMWWPALGGLAVGVGGYLFSPALGVGYDVIDRLMTGDYTLRLLIGILLVKSTIWAISLGSGTSGGVLAPLLMMGGALGGLEGLILPDAGPGFWPLVAMGATLGGTMRSPFTSVIFTLELTHDVLLLLPLLLAAMVAHGFTVLTLRRSILTEKVARRGYHLSREYAIDPLEIVFVREVMRRNIVALPANLPLAELASRLTDEETPRGQHLFPVLDAEERLIGVVTRSDILTAARATTDGEARVMMSIIRPRPVVAFPDEPLRLVVYRMAETGLTCFPVVRRDDPRRLEGLVSLNEVLKGRARILEAERRRERLLSLHIVFPRYRLTGPRRRDGNGTGPSR